MTENIRNSDLNETSNKPKTLALPSAEILRNLLSYDAESGLLSWKERPREKFTSQRAWSTWNSRYSGSKALHYFDGKGFMGRIDRRPYYAHRIIWKLVTGNEPNGEIDHIDGNPKNNEFSNIRLVDHAANMRNKARPRVTSRPYNGVFFRFGSWKASIKVDRKFIHLGSFPTMEEAIAARQQAERDHDFHPNHGKRLIETGDTIP